MEIPITQRTQIVLSGASRITIKMHLFVAGRRFRPHPGRRGSGPGNDSCCIFKAMLCEVMTMLLLF